MILGSILLAFGIDAWWDGAQEQRDERMALERLDAEFAALDSVLETWQAGQEGVALASEVLLGHTVPGGSSALSPDSVGGRRLWTLMVNWKLDPPSATLRSLEFSGQLAAFQNQALVTQIASWRALLTDLQADEEVAARRVDDEFRPYLMSHVAWRTVSSLAQRRELAGAASAFPSGFGDLLASREFENYVDRRRTDARIIAGNYDVVRSGLGHIRTLISGELGN